MAQQWIVISICVFILFILSLFVYVYVCVCIYLSIYLSLSISYTYLYGTVLLTTSQTTFHNAQTRANSLVHAGMHCPEFIRGQFPFGSLIIEMPKSGFLRTDIPTSPASCSFTSRSRTAIHKHLAVQVLNTVSISPSKSSAARKCF